MSALPRWHTHAALGAACVAGCWIGALLDQLHAGGLLWRTLCLTPGWPSLGQLGLRVELMPLSLAATLAAPVLLWSRLPGRPWLPLLLCMAAAVLALPPAIFACRLSTAAGLDWNRTLPGMLMLESLLLLGVHGSLCALTHGVCNGLPGMRPGMTLGIAAAVLGLATGGQARAAPDAHIDWGYDGEHGPKHWAELAPDFGECGLGQAQSPIDIDHATPREDLPELDIHYRTAALRIVNNGHTVQVNVPDGDVLDIGGHVYRLMQFHFHSPSEEHVDGKTYDMELHLVHRDSEGHLAVLGVLMAEGRANPALDHVFTHLPTDHDAEHLEADQIDPAALIPPDHSYYYYEGSLTTPPCAEHVSWYVLEAPIEASAEQIAQFRRLYAHNARPVQPLNARPVYEHRARKHGR